MLVFFFLLMVQQTVDLLLLHLHHAKLQILLRALIIEKINQIHHFDISKYQIVRFIVTGHCVCLLQFDI